MSPIVFRLEQRGLIDRSFDSKDRRLILLSLTPEGEEILNHSNEAAWKVIAEAMEPLSQEELTALSAILAKLESHIIQLLDGKNEPEKVIANN